MCEFFNLKEKNQNAKEGKKSMSDKKLKINFFSSSFVKKKQEERQEKNIIDSYLLFYFIF